MNKLPIVLKLEQKQLKTDIPEFCVGDTVRVHIRITEGSKERTHAFVGTVIARKGAGISETFTLHRVAFGEGMERVFLLHSPGVTEIELVREGKVRRSKLYYLRGTKGKASKVKGRIVSRRKNVETSPAPKAAEPVQATEESTEEVNA
ncbi:MAG: 50S ribosomal protein L19 [Waddliaceae bacterium]